MQSVLSFSLGKCDMPSYDVFIARLLHRFSLAQPWLRKQTLIGDLKIVFFKVSGDNEDQQYADGSMCLPGGEATFRFMYGIFTAKLPSRICEGSRYRMSSL
ncbi:hypothetical protein Dimus_000464 [Dionaea muscipula]